jgi:hypothetical protein
MIIEEGRAAEDVWKAYPQELSSEGVLEGSLPHRSPEERRALAGAFLGITTWQRVCSEFKIPPSALPDEVLEAGV